MKTNSILVLISALVLSHVAIASPTESQPNRVSMKLYNIMVKNTEKMLQEEKYEMDRKSKKTFENYELEDYPNAGLDNNAERTHLYSSLLNSDELEALYEEEFSPKTPENPTTGSLSKRRTEAPLKPGPVGWMGQYPSVPSGIEPHTVGGVSGSAGTGIHYNNSYYGNGGARMPNHSTQFLVAYLRLDTLGTDISNGYYTMEGTGQKIHFKFTRNSNTGQLLITPNFQNAVIRQVAVDKPITTSLIHDLIVTIHTNEYGYTYLELKQYNQILYSALATFNYVEPPWRTNGLTISYGSYSLNSRWDARTAWGVWGDLGWFEEQ